MAHYVISLEQRTNIKKHPLGTDEANDGTRPLPSAAVSGICFLLAPVNGRLSLLESLGWTGAAPGPQPGSSDGDTPFGVRREVEM